MRASTDQAGEHQHDEHPHDDRDAPDTFTHRGVPAGEPGWPPVSMSGSESVMSVSSGGPGREFIDTMRL